MLFAVSSLIGCAVVASDGGAGKVKDFLFDDRGWRIRWMVVDSGDWLPGRQVLIHPSAIAPLELTPKPALPMMSFGPTLTVFVNLTKQQIEAGPEAAEDEPVTRRIEQGLYDYYGWDPFWGASSFGGGAVVMQPSVQPQPAEVAAGAAPDRDAPPGDPHLGSVADVKGYIVHAVDGDLGHVEHMLVDDTNWDVRYFVVATRNWLPRKLVQIAAYAVTDIDWVGERVNMNVTRSHVRSAPEFDPLALTDKVKEEQLHRHFGWPGYRS